MHGKAGRPLLSCCLLPVGFRVSHAQDVSDAKRSDDKGGKRYDHGHRTLPFPVKRDPNRWVKKGLSGHPVCSISCRSTAGYRFLLVGGFPSFPVLFVYFHIRIFPRSCQATGSSSSSRRALYGKAPCVTGALHRNCASCVPGMGIPDRVRARLPPISIIIDIQQGSPQVIPNRCGLAGAQDLPCPVPGPRRSRGGHPGGRPRSGEVGLDGSRPRSLHPRGWHALRCMSGPGG